MLYTCAVTIHVVMLCACACTWHCRYFSMHIPLIVNEVVTNQPFGTSESTCISPKAWLQHLGEMYYTSILIYHNSIRGNTVVYHMMISCCWQKSHFTSLLQFSRSVVIWTVWQNPWVQMTPRGIVTCGRGSLSLSTLERCLLSPSFSAGAPLTINISGERLNHFSGPIPECSIYTVHVSKWCLVWNGIFFVYPEFVYSYFNNCMCVMYRYMYYYTMRH